MAFMGTGASDGGLADLGDTVAIALSRKKLRKKIRKTPTKYEYSLRIHNQDRSPIFESEQRAAIWLLHNPTRAAIIRRHSAEVGTTFIEEPKVRVETRLVNSNDAWETMHIRKPLQVLKDNKIKPDLRFQRFATDSRFGRKDLQPRGKRRIAFFKRSKTPRQRDFDRA